MQEASYAVETARATYYLDADGAVIARTNGPRGWSYSGAWTILGSARRWNSGYIVRLSDAADGADIGHGFVCDLDHGTRRRWGNERAQRVRRATELDRETAARLQTPERVGARV